MSYSYDIPKVKVPAYFCVGRYDYNTPFELIENYYDQLVAPKKELIWFEDSAHFPHFEEPTKFAEIIKRIKEKLKTHGILSVMQFTANDAVM